MKLSRLEKWVMTNPLRAWLQRRYEAPYLLEGVELPPGATCLEIGCGWGMGALLIAERFPGCRVIATDYDAAMIELAQAVRRGGRRGRADPGGA